LYCIVLHCIVLYSFIKQADITQLMNTQLYSYTIASLIEAPEYPDEAHPEHPFYLYPLPSFSFIPFNLKCIELLTESGEV